MSDLARDYLNKADYDLDDAIFLCNASRYTPSVTRSYYAAWNAVQALLISKELSPKTHLGTHVQFNQYFIKTGTFPKHLSDKLTLLEQLRETGDYEPDFRATEEQAQSAVADATIIIQAIKKYFDALS